MTKIKKPEFLSNVYEAWTKGNQAGTKTGFLRKEPAAAYTVTQQVGFRKRDDTAKTSCFQGVPCSGTAAKMADNLPVFSAFSTPAFSVSNSISGGVGIDEKNASGEVPLLYLNSNNTIRPSVGSGVNDAEKLCNLLSPYHRKAAFALKENVAALIASTGLDRLGFLTLTFPDNCVDPKQAYARFDSFNTNYLSSHAQFGSWLCVKERQRRGAWHYHLLIDCGGDIRTGIDWEQIEQRNYRSANSHLRSLWVDLRVNLPKYGFGRSELLPIRSNVEAMSRYVGKYISKHVGSRKQEDAGVRMCSYSRNWPRSNAHFQWHTPNSQQWRANLCAFAKFFELNSLDDLRERFGSRWAYRFADTIILDDWPARLKEKMCQAAPAKVQTLHAHAAGPLLELPDTPIFSTEEIDIIDSNEVCFRTG